MGLTKIAISGYYGMGNTGDEAMLLATLKLFNKIDNQMEFIIFSSAPNLTSKEYSKFKVKAVDYSLSRNFCGVIKAIKRSDLIILGGGGSIINDLTFLNLPGWFSKLFIAKLFSKKTLIYNVGVESLSSWFGKGLTKLVLDYFVDLIVVRDKYSKETLKKIGIKNEIYCLIDPAFRLKPIKKREVNKIFKNEKIDTKKRLIGVSLRRLESWFNNQYKKINQDKLNQIIAINLDKIIAEKDVNLVFIPFQIKNKDDDNLINKAVRDKMTYKNRTSILSGLYSPQEIKGIIKKLDILIGMRLHSLVFSISENIPSIAISYLPKVKYFMNSVGQKDNIIELTNFKEDELFLKTKKALEFIGRTKKEIYKKRLSLKVQEKKTERLLKEFIKNDSIK